MKKPLNLKRTTPTLTTLPDDLIREFIGPYLSKNELLFFSETCKKALNVSPRQRKKQLANALLQCVMDDDKDKVKRLLEIHPELLQVAGRQTDHAGRLFEITAFRYALWAKAADMCLLMMDTLPSDYKGISIRQNLIAQIEQQTNHGCDYQSEKGLPVQNESHYALRLARAYLDYLRQYQEPQEFNQQRWCELVGEAQKDLPVSLIAAIYTPSPRYNPPGDIIEGKRYLVFPPPLPNSLTTKLNVYDHKERRMRLWFDTTQGAHQLGRDFAIKRELVGNSHGYSLDRAETCHSLRFWDAKRMLEEIKTHFMQQDSKIIGFKNCLEQTIQSIEIEQNSSFSCLIS